MHDGVFLEVKLACPRGNEQHTLVPPTGHYFGTSAPCTDIDGGACRASAPLRMGDADEGEYGQGGCLHDTAARGNA